MALHGKRSVAGLGGLLAVAAASACVSLWGLDDLHYDSTPAGGAGGAAGGGGDGGSGGFTTSSAGGGTTGGGGTGGSAGCEEAECASCFSGSCALSHCSAAVQPCTQSDTCTALGGCAGICAPEDAECLSACMVQEPNGVAAFIPARDCVLCSPDACGPQCEAACTGCDEGGDCLACINSACATSACNTSVGACLGDADCTAYLACLNSCNGDEACQADCQTNNQPGALLYNLMLLCLSCQPSTCAGVCQIPAETCAAWAGAT